MRAVAAILLLLGGCSAAAGVIDAGNGAEEGGDQTQLIETVAADQPSIRAIGIYQGGSGHSHGDHPTEDVTIEVDDDRGSKLYLALSSYEPVRWNLTGPGAARVSGVYLDGYHQQSVTGAVPGTTIDNRSANRERDSAGTRATSSDWAEDPQFGAGGRVSCTYTFPEASGGGCGSAHAFLANARSIFHAPVATFTGIYEGKHFRLR